MPTIRNGRLPGGERADIAIGNGLIVDEASDDLVIDADGLTISPGFIDIQINGGFGHDFTQDPTTIWDVGEKLPELGVTSFVPTVVTSPGEVTDLAMEVVAHRRPQGYRGADVIGLHFEGPWIAPEMHGAHNPGHIAEPDLETALRWADSGLVRIVTLAPEMPGALDVVRALHTGGVTVSLGHTKADFSTTRAAYAAGASLATHLFNQMTPIGHREPGGAVAALLDARACLVIVDGLHLHDAIVELVWRLLGAERTILITDAMAALGLGPGTYPLGEGPITVDSRGPRTADGRLAGSVVTPGQALTNLQRITGAHPGDAIRTMTATPAAAVGLRDRGTLRPGTRGDVVLVDDRLDVVRVLSAGETVFAV
ncbi:MAG: N-acetylglucosamine-6-phosphate deacetylase [Acidimicrobiia bacterium]|jgi:N-acetylglucosamine-6-phosphate deacetylase